MKKLACLLAVAVLAGCAATDSPPTKGSGQQQEQGVLTKAASTPFADLNVASKEIPPVLVEANKHPYAVPTDSSCAALTASVHELDEVLGDDLDAGDAQGRDNGGVGALAGGALVGAAEGLIPFRGWVRKLSGAERHAKGVAAAILAGTVRRAFLKGLSQAAGCRLVAAPRT